MSHCVSQCFASLVVCFLLQLGGGSKKWGIPKSPKISILIWSNDLFGWFGGTSGYLHDPLLPWAAPARPLPWLQASAATGNFWSLGDTTGTFGGSKKPERVFPHHLPGDVEAFVINVFNSFQSCSAFLHVFSLLFYGFPSILVWFSTLFWWSQRFVLARQVRSFFRPGAPPRRDAAKGRRPGAGPGGLHLDGRGAWWMWLTIL